MTSRENDLLAPFSLNLFPGTLLLPPRDESETLGTRLFNRYRQAPNEGRVHNDYGPLIKEWTT